MADVLISPEAYTTPGGVPRKLLAGVFLVVTLVAMLAFMVTSNDEPLMTGDQKARAELMKPETVAAQTQGNGKWVDEAAERARLERDRVEKERLAEAAASEGPRALPGMQPAQAGAGRALRDMSSPGAAGVAVPGTLAPGSDAAAIERSLAARTSNATVFDDGARGAAPAAGARLADLAHVAVAPSGAGANPGEMLAPVLEAIKASQAGPAASPTRAESERAWASQLPRAGALPILRQQPAEADLMLYQGTVIPCVLTRRLNSDMPGVVTARVSMDVYDSRTSRRLLLPKGALLVGAYNNDVKQGQSRLQFAFTRLRMPDGSTFDLPGATGADHAGQAGVEGQVDRHFFRSFGSALLLGVLADRVTRIAALPSGGPQGTGGVSATGQVFIDTARAELERNRAIPPTVTVEEGARINVEVVRDMAFESVYSGASHG